MSNVNNEISSIAESVRANLLFDMTFEVKALEFFRLKSKKDCQDKIKLSNSIYKYNKYGS